MGNKSYLPICLDLSGKKCLVIGGGNVAFRKIKTLLNYNLKIDVITKEVRCNEIIEFAKKDKINLKIREIENEDIEKEFMVIVATENSELNLEIYKRLKDKNILINSVDDTENSNFIFGAILKRGDLNIMVSTGGASPLLAVKIRDKIGEILGQEYESVLKILKEQRKKIIIKIKKSKERFKFFKDSISLIDIGEKIDISKFEKKLKKMEEEKS